MDNKCFWLPELIDFNDYNNDWHKYDDYLYSIFSKHFLENHPYFMGKEVYPRQHPMYNGKFESYYHITCGHYKDVEERAPDFRRCERIKWPKALIENSMCKCKPNCDNYIIWKKKYKNKYRYSLLLKDEKYLVILEERPRYFILISAFPLTYSHAYHDQLKYYENAKETENAIVR